MSPQTQPGSLWDEITLSIFHEADKPSPEAIEEAIEKETGRKLQEILG